MKAMDSVPKRYLAAWGQFQCQCPAGVTEQAWRQAIDGADRFLDQWGKLADSFGWSPGDLFDVPRDGAMGLAWWLTGRAVTALEPEHASVGPDGSSQPRQEIAAIPDQCRETPSFLDRLDSETSVTIFSVALSLRRSTASRAAMHSATGLTGDRWRLAWPPALA
jgi:hypothetical protein